MHRPAHPDQPDLLGVLTVDTRAGADALDHSTVSGLVGGGQVVYASTERLYVANGNENGTAVHAFDTTGRGRTPHVASGTLERHVLASSAMSAHEGAARMATSSPPFNPDNRVVVLAEDGGGRLREVGRTARIGPGEEIKSVRWVDDLATIVTFRQVDPFYVVDLSRPQRPQVLGELKVPGYSGYLHPVGDGRVLGVGPAGFRRGIVPGAQASLFDVTDLTRPRRADVLELGPGRSTAEGDPHGFTYLPERRLALLSGTWRDEPCRRKDLWRDGCSPERPTLVGVRVASDGRLVEVARFTADTKVRRILPVGDRLAVVTRTSVVLLDPSDLRVLGEVDLHGL